MVVKVNMYWRALTFGVAILTVVFVGFWMGHYSGYLMMLQGSRATQYPTNMAAVAPKSKPWVRLVSRVKSIGQEDSSLAPQGVVYVPLRKDDRALMIDATLDKRSSVRLMLDTGATYTTISEELAEKLGYDLEDAPHVRITTANGQVLLPKIRLKSISLGGYTAKNVDATVMPMPSDVPFSGLLGLSFVRNHRITIDTKASHLVIEPSGKAG